MGKREKVRPGQVLLKAVVLTLGLYLLIQLLLTFCVLRQIIPEEQTLPFIALSAVLAPLPGGFCCGHALPWSKWLAGLSNASVFAAVLVAVGICCEGGIAWKGSGGILLACILLGGLLSGLLMAGKGCGGRKKRRR